MAESFENLEDILPDWAKADVKKTLAEAVDKSQKQEKESKNRFFCRKWVKHNTRAVSVERHQTKHNMFLYKTNRLHVADASVQ